MFYFSDFHHYIRKCRNFFNNYTLSKNIRDFHVFYMSFIGKRAGPPRARVGINRCWFMMPRQNRGHRHRFWCNLDNRNRFDNPENLNGATIKAPASRRFVYKSDTLSADIMRESTYHKILRDGYRFYTRHIWSTCISLRDMALIIHAYDDVLVIM